MRFVGSASVECSFSTPPLPGVIRLDALRQRFLDVDGAANAVLRCAQRHLDHRDAYLHHLGRLAFLVRGEHQAGGTSRTTYRRRWIDDKPKLGRG